MDPRSALIIGLLVWSATTALLLCVVAWHRRTAPGAVAFAITAASTVVWSLGAALQLTTSREAEMVVWSNIQFLGIVALPVGWVVMAFQFVGRSRWMKPGNLAGLSVVPAITLALMWTNPLHELVRGSSHADISGPIPVLHATFGPWFWVHAVYSNLLLFIGVAVLAGVAILAPPRHGKQAILLIAGLAVPAAWNLAYISGFDPFNGFDATPIFTGAGAVVMAWGLFRHDLFVTPTLAYDRVVHAIGEGVIVLDSRQRVVDMNPAAQEVLGLDDPSVIGKKATEAFTGYPKLVELFESPDPPYRVLVTESAGEPAYCAARLESLADRSGNTLGSIVVLRDFTQRKRAEDALKEREQRYRELADSLPETVFEIDVTGRLTFVNSAGLSTFGYSREEVAAGLNVMTMVSPEDQERARQSLLAAMRADPGEAQEYLVIRKDGTTFPSLVASSSILGDSAPEGLRGVLVDLTPQKRAAREREELLAELQRTSAEQQAILESIAVGLVIHDSSGQVVRMNKYADGLMGFTLAPELPGLQSADQLGFEDGDGIRIRPENLPSVRALKGEAVRDMIIHVPVSDGRRHSMSVSSAPIRTSDGSIHGAVTTFIDISRLLQLQEQRDDILRSISHDLRSPLTVILGHGQILRQDMQKARVRERWKTSMDSVILAGQQMNRMIRDLVDSLRMESGQLKLETEELDLSDLVCSIKERLNGTIDSDRVRVKMPSFSPVAEADRDRVERIIVNLITNALKYSDPDTEVEVSFSQGEGEVNTSVTDHGDGIPDDILPRLFRRYGRSEDQGGRRDSLGLGLYISKGLVEAHGGSIWVSSVAGKGSTFGFSLPASSSQDHGQQSLPLG